MPIVPKPGHVRPLNIIDGEEFDNIYNTYKGIINGGMDRESIPENALDQTKFQDYAFHQYWQAYVKLPEERISLWNEVIPNTNVDGITFLTYVGGWEANTVYPLKVTTVEGALHVEFNCWYWFDNDVISGNVSGDWAQFQILVNSNVVAETHYLYQRMGTVHLVADVPVATGPQEIKVAYKLPSRNSTSATNVQFFYFAGGNLLAINRYR